jgi:hypothetical protein
VGESRARAAAVREETIGVELSQRHKRNTFADQVSASSLFV